MNHALSKRLLSLIHEFGPDIIVATHPFVAEMVSHLKGKGFIDAKLLVVMTDYAPHKTWIAEHVDGYIVANDDINNILDGDLGTVPSALEKRTIKKLGDIDIVIAGLCTFAYATYNLRK